MMYTYIYIYIYMHKEIYIYRERDTHTHTRIRMCGTCAACTAANSALSSSLSLPFRSAAVPALRAQLGTNTTVTARFRPWLEPFSDQSPLNFIELCHFHLSGLHSCQLSPLLLPLSRPPAPCPPSLSSRPPLISDSGFGDWRLGFGVWGLRFWVLGFGF